MVRIALILVSFIAFNLISVKSLAQDSTKIEKMDGHFYFQPNFGASQYYGDLNPNDYWNQDPQFAFGAILGYQLSPVFGFRGQFLKADLYSKRSDQNLEFYSELWDAALNLTININEIFTKYNESRVLNFYLFSGAGISSYKSTLENIKPKEVIYLHSDKQNDFFVPIGGGVSFRFSPHLALNLEYGDHITFSDGLDFITGGGKNDHYSYASFGIQVRYKIKDIDGDGILDENDACPKIPGKIELAGCPDKDNDGIADKDDLCPDAAGTYEYHGCSDTDGDGTIDIEDACPHLAGKKELNGCPDRDYDGIPDKNDNCPDEFGKKELAGCPDRDGDGVADKDDACPDNNGLAVFAGCPDTDGDSIIDSKDSCKYEAGKKEFNGCPDRDNDSIADKDDSCPDIAGKREFDGCPDSDGDGITDNDDACPYIKGLIKFSGCPDTDGDGIPDIRDDCPEVAGVADNKGCPVIKKKVETFLQKTVTFNSGSSQVFPSFKNMLSLDEIVKSMQENPDAILSVTGFTDDTEPNDLQLSEKRADYVIDYLKKKGMTTLKIEKSFVGKAKPVASNKTNEGRALNRRVEIKISK
jgi:outer membrane protein OmpA-like peptidoglycan-associated protein